MINSAKDANELALIQALNRLKGYQFDGESVDASATSDSDQIAHTFFAFNIGDHQFAVSADSFCEVITGVSVAAIPNSPNQLVGLCNLRGVLVPVFQLHQMFDQTLPRKNIVFCMGKGDKSFGLMINALPVSTILKPYEQLHESTQELPQIKFLAESAYLSKGRTVYLLEAERLGEKLLQFTAN